MLLCAISQGTICTKKISNPLLKIADFQNKCPKLFIITLRYRLYFLVVLPTFVLYFLSVYTIFKSLFTHTMIKRTTFWYTYTFVHTYAISSRQPHLDISAKTTIGAKQHSNKTKNANPCTSLSNKLTATHHKSNKNATHTFLIVFITFNIKC